MSVHLELPFEQEVFEVLGSKAEASLFQRIRDP